MRILRFVVRRLLLLLPVLFGILVLTFLLVRVMPGDPIASLLPPGEVTQEQIKAARHEYGIDKPMLQQFVVYVKDMFVGNFGRSFQTGRPITSELAQHLGPTLELITISFVIAVLFSIPFGLLSAMRLGKSSDHAIRFGSLAAGSFSPFWLGLLLILLFYYKLGWAPTPHGRYDPATNLHTITHIDVIDALITGNFAAFRSVMSHLVLPVITLAVIMSPGLVRVVRSSAIDVLRSEAYSCAVAHGLSSRTRTLHYVVRQSLISLPTLGALIFGHALGGVVLVESVFSWDGVGQWALSGLLFRNYAVVQMFVLLSAFIYVIVFLIADIVHALLDPRVRI